MTRPRNIRLEEALALEGAEEFGTEPQRKAVVRLHLRERAYRGTVRRMAPWRGLAVRSRHEGGRAA